MDAIAYLKDPENETEMSNVVKSHARYTVATAKTFSEQQKTKYNKYDHENDTAARDYLLSSIEESLCNRIE